MSSLLSSVPLPSPVKADIPVQKDAFLTDTLINLSARTTQVFFSSGVIFTAIAITSHASAIVTGGSFLLHGSFILVKVFEIAVCFDLMKIAANVASIYESNSLRSWVEKNIGPTAGQFIEKGESFFALPQSVIKNIKGNDSLITALIHGTILAPLIKPFISEQLNKKAVPTTLEKSS